MSSNEVPHDPVTGEILAAPPHNPYALRSLSAILGALDHGDYAPVLEGALAEIPVFFGVAPEAAAP